MEYKWKEMSMQKADAQKVGLELEKLRLKKGGAIQPKDVVIKAESNKNSELHKCFEWNNRRAADKYRIEQAKLILRAIVNVVEIDGEKTEIRCFESVQYDTGAKRPTRFYVSTADALVDIDLREQVIQDIMDSLNETEHKLRIYKAFIDGGPQAIKLLRQAKVSIRIKKIKKTKKMAV